MRDRLDGVRQPPPVSITEPECVDCGVTETTKIPGYSWPDGKMLRKYSDGDYSCKPCANGEQETQGWDNAASSPIDDVRDSIKKNFEEFKRIDHFPKVKVAPQENIDYEYVPATDDVPAHSKPCKFTFTGRKKCDTLNLQNIPGATATEVRDLLSDIFHRTPVVPNYDA